MSELITTMFTGVSDAVAGLADGIKEMFMNLIYVDPAASSPVLSEFAKFSFLFMGVSLAFGLGYFILNKIRA